MKFLHVFLASDSTLEEVMSCWNVKLARHLFIFDFLILKMQNILLFLKKKTIEQWRVLPEQSLFLN